MSAPRHGELSSSARTRTCILQYNCIFLISSVLLAQIWLERLGVESASHSWYHVDRAATTNREGETPHLGAQTIINIAKNRAFTNTQPKSKEEYDHMQVL